MPYNNNFYEQYEDYLKEPEVRKAHDWIFQIAMSNRCFDNVIDFGCGLKEFNRYAKPKHYIGIDNNCEADINIDYRKNDLEFLNSYSPSAFVSLFSIEITNRYTANYFLYSNIFEQLSVSCGLVSGFYYANTKAFFQIEEAGSIRSRSHQTLEDIDKVQKRAFTEKRIILPVPSKMFGEDVFEVWKILERS